MKKNNANAIWTGKLKDGKGTANIPGVGKEVTYSYSSRFEDKNGTNPEGLIAAAHAQCFSMALSQLLTEKGYNPAKITTSSEVTLGEKDGAPTILSSKLVCDAEVPEIEKNEFDELADTAKNNCPVSKVLAAIDINLQASLAN